MSGLPQRGFDPDKAKFHFQKAKLGSAPVQLSGARRLQPSTQERRYPMKAQAQRLIATCLGLALLTLLILSMVVFGITGLLLGDAAQQVLG